jgi:capsular polysaccharide biosynthesis protein
MVLGAGFLLAMLSFVATAWLLDRFDDSVRSAGDLERRLQAPSLGRLPRSATGELSWN